MSENGAGLRNDRDGCAGVEVHGAETARAGSGGEGEEFYSVHGYHGEVLVVICLVEDGCHFFFFGCWGVVGESNGMGSGLGRKRESCDGLQEMWD